MKPRMRTSGHGTRRGGVLVYVSVAMVAFCGLVSLAIDVAHARMVKTQLQGAADAAARYAATGLSSGVTAAQNNAVSAAASNTADGTAVVLNPASDIVFGTWSSGTFTALSGSAQSGANAVQVFARRTGATGNAVQLTFGGLIGKSTADVTASAIALYKSGQPAGLIGLNSISAGSNLFVASYKSSVTTTPTQSSYDSNAVVETNGTLSAGSGTVHGNVVLGPGGAVSGESVTGSTTTQGSAITEPAVTMQVVVNPGGVSQTPVIANNQTVTWPGGTYYFTSFTMNDSGTISFTGPATIYLNGSASIHDFNTINAYQGLPANLTIYQSNGNTFFLHDSDNVTAQLIAPGCSYDIAHDHCNWYGSVVAASITAHDNDSFYCDEDLGSGNASVSIVQ